MLENLGGKSKQNLNNQSIGIELQNKGHNLGYEKFSQKTNKISSRYFKN